MSPTFRALSVPNYRVYAAGALVSNIGTWLQNTAQAWLVLELTGSGTALGIMVALQLLPTLLLSAYGGVLADRYPKRTLLRVMQVAMALPAAALGVLAILDVVALWHVYVLVAVFGVGRALEAPARQSFVPEMVGTDDLGNAVALNSASFNAGRLIGPALAGVAIAAIGGGVVGTGWVILANALSYGAAFWALQVMDTTRLAPTPVIGRGRGALADGLRYVRSRPDLVLLLTCVFFIGGFGMNFQITSALMATEVFGKGADGFGVLGSLLAIGSFAGALLAARRTRPRLRFVIVFGLMFAVMQVLSGLMPTYVTYAVTLPLIGITLLSTVTTANALIQLTTAPEMRGRVAALYLMVFLGSVPFVAPGIGWIGEAFGPRVAVVLSGAVAGVGIAGTVSWYVLHRRDRRAELVAMAVELRSQRARRADLRGRPSDRGRLRVPRRLREHRGLGPRHARDDAHVG